MLPFQRPCSATNHGVTNRVQCCAAAGISRHKRCRVHRSASSVALVAEAAHHVILLESGPVALGSLIDTDLAEIKRSHSRDKEMQLAKRYVKVLEALADLEKSCRLLGPAPRSTTASPDTDNRRVAETSLAIVPVHAPPVIRTVAPDRQRPSEQRSFSHGPWFGAGVLDSYRQSSLWKGYSRVIQWALSFVKNLSGQRGVA